MRLFEGKTQRTNLCRLRSKRDNMIPSGGDVTISIFIFGILKFKYIDIPIEINNNFAKSFKEIDLP